MRKENLIKVDHNIKVGQKCNSIPPNISGNCIFYEDGKPIGFFIDNIEGKLKKLVEIANKEFNSKNVPKSIMSRAGKLAAIQAGKTKEEIERIDVEQMSCIIGSIPPNALMKREYPNISSVHNVKTAQTFIKAMLLAAKECETLIKKIMPEQYEFQKQCIIENVPKKYRFGELFTSSISNFNIAAPYHRDVGNLKGCVNAIITKRQNAKGGNLTIPDYGATMDSVNNSLLVYPAWKNVHGVTPIIPTHKGGYRNSLIFYPLKAFKKFV